MQMIASKKEAWTGIAYHTTAYVKLFNHSPLNNQELFG